MSNLTLHGILAHAESCAGRTLMQVKRNEDIALDCPKLSREQPCFRMLYDWQSLTQTSANRLNRVHRNSRGGSATGTGKTRSIAGGRLLHTG